MAFIARLSKEDRDAITAEQQEMYDARAQQTEQEAYTAATQRLENGEPNAMSPGAIKAAAQRDGVEIIEEADVPKKKKRDADYTPPTGRRGADYTPPSGRRGSRRPAGEAIGSETPAGASTQVAPDDDDEDDGDAPTSEAAGLGEDPGSGSVRGADYGVSH